MLRWRSAWDRLAWRLRRGQPMSVRLRTVPMDTTAIIRTLVHRTDTMGLTTLLAVSLSAPDRGSTASTVTRTGDAARVSTGVVGLGVPVFEGRLNSMAALRSTAMVVSTTSMAAVVSAAGRFEVEVASMVVEGFTVAGIDKL